MSLEMKLNSKILVKEIKDFAKEFYKNKPYFYVAVTIAGIYLTYLVKGAIK